MNYKSLLLRLIIAVIFIQSLFYKFSAHEQAIHIFTTLEMEPWGRISIGVAELVVSILLFVNKTKILALLGSLGLMLGAIFFHLTTPLGIVVEWGNNSDHGLLFGMAVIVLVCSSTLLINRYRNHSKSINDFLGLR
jgi:uncharacterized membrane protein YphA (DoxX/SURF4 family)